jgi:hypothetical protein
MRAAPSPTRSSLVLYGRHESSRVWVVGMPKTEGATSLISCQLRPPSIERKMPLWCCVPQARAGCNYPQEAVEMCRCEAAGGPQLQGMDGLVARGRHRCRARASAIQRSFCARREAPCRAMAAMVGQAKRKRHGSGGNQPGARSGKPALVKGDRVAAVRSGLPGITLRVRTRGSNHGTVIRMPQCPVRIGGARGEETAKRKRRGWNRALEGQALGTAGAGSRFAR